MAQAEGAEILARAKRVDLVVGPQSYHRLPEMIARLARDGGHALETDFPAESKFDALPKRNPDAGAGAFLTVQEGCDKFCTFCVVPYTRGSEYSRPPRRSWPRPKPCRAAARAKSRCWARTSTPIAARDRTARPGRSRASSSAVAGSKGCSGCATRPAIRAT